MPANSRPSNALGKQKIGLFYFANWDGLLLLFLLTLLGIGLICLFSASYAYANYYEDGDSYYFIKKQMIYAVLGLVAMVVLSFIDYHIWHYAAWILAGISIILLVIVLLLPGGDGGVKRWIPVPFIGQFQPSEVAKFSVILLLSHIISQNYSKMKQFKMFALCVVILGAFAFFIIEEPHLSCTILILGIGVAIMFVGGVRTGYLVPLLIAGGVAVLFLVTVMKYEADRIDVWLDPLGEFAKDRDKAWQTVQSLYAIGSGGLMGLGIGNSRQKHLFLPEPQNDFIFSVICEELGFIGAALIIVLFALLVWRGITIALNAKDKFGSLLAVGISAQIGIQVILNIAVVSNAMPNTGIGLPFFSFGGSSIIMLLGEMGVLLSVARQARLGKNKTGSKKAAKAKS